MPPVHSQNTQSLYTQYIATIHSHYTPSTQLEYTFTIPPVYNQNTQALYPQFTARIHSNYTPSTQLEYTITIPQLEYSHYTPSLQLEHSHYTPIHSYNTQFTARIHSHYSSSLQLQYTGYTLSIQQEFTLLPSTQVECTVKHTQYTAKIQSLHPQYTARINRRNTLSIQLE